jgi:hypothetical protein
MLLIICALISFLGGYDYAGKHRWDVRTDTEKGFGDSYSGGVPEVDLRRGQAVGGIKKEKTMGGRTLCGKVKKKVKRQKVKEKKKAAVLTDSSLYLF